ncbi:DUF1329 domain-containing protein [Halopseudomonas sp. Lyrl_26]|uniref:DUF1329 domain-containing protein n=1 Tax=Halopseudomonas sp. Lyrl_26 TaxID=3110923 RepID=UPI003F7ECFC5
MSFIKAFIASALAIAISATVQAAVTAEEAEQLGTTLTLVGAEKAGNADGSIPEYTGGVTTPPADYQTGSGILPSPFADESPVLSITSANMAQYASQLTAGTSELLKRYPNSYRVDLYPTHRSVAFPEYVLENTVKNATSAETTNGGLGLKNLYAGFPFPIPSTGNEAMWNHLLSFSGHAIKGKFDTVNVNSNGRATLSTTGEILQEFPIYDPARSGMLSGADIYKRIKINYTAPARRAGEAVLTINSIDEVENPRRAWQYLPGQRRVKLAPDVSYDTPNPGSAGMTTYDDSWIFNGAMDRFDFKLIGKKEIIIPYNTYKLVYWKNADEVTTPDHLNPDLVRWELHRVWVVEATLKPGKRHIYSKRVFYLDEDSWVALASDQYDGRDQLYRSGFASMAPSYVVPAPQANTQVFYDFIAGSWNMVGVNVGNYGGNKHVDALPDSEWSADALAGSGIR